MSNEYDQAVDAWREATRRVMRVGDDDPKATADDLKDMLETMIEEENEE